MHEYMSEVRVWGLICPGRTEEIGRVRRWTRDILSGHPSADDAVVIVSELGTNALLYTASGQENGVFQVALALSEPVLAVSVTDAGDSATIPRIASADAAAVHGRGLSMVSTLANHIAIHDTGEGHTVTAELTTARPGGHP
ncbi:ATP-binding protein [Streptomyces katsurahamanus]|uniref:ATP-binding protein n=2 Tax=Streptomyces katsurahamanus TaxID=2577098 RepID=A0ABW9NV74_9ACTN|nr:ATP-binding protein [Streptomyces katsurahamanus]MQS37049.1 ATP-binding protein [Streptomyces katsurahamanus]